MEKTKGQLLYDLRVELGLSIIGFARRVEVSGTLIGMLEKGQRNLTEEWIDRISSEFHVDERYFTGELPLKQAIKDNRQEQVGDRIKKLRMEKRLSQEDLARMSGLSQHVYSAIERGANYREKTLVKMAEALDVSVDYLLYGDKQRMENPVDEQMINWLWQHPGVRKKIREQMEE